MSLKCRVQEINSSCAITTQAWFTLNDWVVKRAGAYDGTLPKPVFPSPDRWTLELQGGIQHYAVAFQEEPISDVNGRSTQS